MEFLPEAGLKYQIEFFIFKDVASLMLDTSGMPLHKRGYRPVSTEAPLREDVVDYSEIIPYKCKRLLAKKVVFSLFGDRYEIKTKQGVKVFPFDDIKTVTCLGKKKINFQTQNTIYQIKGDSHFPLLEYMNIYFNYQSIKGGHHDRFLGI